jgi:hypothetical protein
VNAGYQLDSRLVVNNSPSNKLAWVFELAFSMNTLHDFEASRRS